MNKEPTKLATKESILNALGDMRPQKTRSIKTNQE